VFFFFFLRKKRFVLRILEKFALPDEREQNFATRRLIAKFLAHRDVLLQRPLSNLGRRNNQEKVASEGLREKGKDEPGHDFIRVVGASYQFKHASTRNSLNLGTRRAQVFENDVSMQIANFSNQKQRGAHVHEFIALCGCVQRVVKEIRDQGTTKNPVVKAVFENVESRHRAVGEMMNINGLKFSFDVVNDHQNEGNILNEMPLLDRLGIEDRGEEEEE